MKRKKWPNRDERESYEISMFIKAYKTLCGRDFKIAEKGEKPDYIIKDCKTDDQFGVELTAVYINNRSVSDIHMMPHNGPVDIPYDDNEIANYKNRLLEAINSKAEKAKKYKKEYPLILSIYVNEYCSIFMDDKKEWEKFVKENKNIFDGASIFSEIVFWPVPDGSVFSVSPKAFQVVTK